ncbi:MAG: hypothetical protein RSA66_10780 [Muribaculaceae bacterium]
MTKYLLLIFSMLFLSGFSQNHLNCNDIDSLYIKHTDFKILSATAVIRDAFESFFNNNHSKKVIIKNNDVICQICSLLNNLEIDSRLDYGANISKKKALISKRGELFWIAIDDLDIRCQIILFSKGAPQFVWISNTYTDIGSTRYSTSKELRSFIENKILGLGKN